MHLPVVPLRRGPISVMSATHSGEIIMKRLIIAVSAAAMLLLGSATESSARARFGVSVGPRGVYLNYGGGRSYYGYRNYYRPYNYGYYPRYYGGYYSGSYYRPYSYRYSYGYPYGYYYYW